MSPLERINLIRNIAEEIAKFQDEEEKFYFIRQYKINPLYYENYGDRFLDAKSSLFQESVTIEILKKIADELEISKNLSILNKKYPTNWKNSKDLKLFISHPHEKKESALKLKNALVNKKINAFVAHEDIKTTKKWREEIRFALNTMDFFVSINCKEFDASQFCQQELGFAISRNVDIVQLVFEKGYPPKAFGEEFQHKIPKNLDDAVDEIIDVAKNSNKIGELYNQINPDSTEDEIPF
jgi:ribosomal protein L17